MCILPSRRCRDFNVSPRRAHVVLRLWQCAQHAILNAANLERLLLVVAGYDIGYGRRGFILRGFYGPKALFLVMFFILRIVFVKKSCEIIPEVRRKSLYPPTQNACRETNEHESAQLNVEARGPRQTINCITRAASDLLPPMPCMSYVRERAYNKRGCADSAQFLYIWPLGRSVVPLRIWAARQSFRSFVGRLRQSRPVIV